MKANCFKIKETVSNCLVTRFIYFSASMNKHAWVRLRGPNSAPRRMYLWPARVMSLANEDAIRHVFGSVRRGQVGRYYSVLLYGSNE
jgi:hypothetical protein